LDKNILFFGISIFLLGFVTSSIQIAEATNIVDFPRARVIDLTCGRPTVNLNIIFGDFYFMEVGCEYRLVVEGRVAANGEAGWKLLEEEWAGLGEPEILYDWVKDIPIPAKSQIISQIADLRCDANDLTVEVEPLGIFGFVDQNERLIEVWVEDGSSRAPAVSFGLWHFGCIGVTYSDLVIGGTIIEIFDDGFLSGAVVVGDPWAASFEFAPGQTLFNDGTTSSFRVSNVEFGFGTGNDMIKYSNLPPSALFDDSITAFDDFGGPPFDEIQTQDFTLQQDSGPTLPTADVFLGVDFFDADGTVIGSPINSFSDLLNVLEDPNFLNNLEANQILFEALDGLPGPGAPTISSPLVFSPSQFGQGVAILGNIDTIIVTRSQQAVGGEIIPIETTSLILAGAQSFSWMMPVVLSVLGIGLFVVSRKSENS